MWLFIFLDYALYIVHITKIETTYSGNEGDIYKETIKIKFIEHS